DRLRAVRTATVRRAGHGDRRLRGAGQGTRTTSGGPLVSAPGATTAGVGPATPAARRRPRAAGRPRAPAPTAYPCRAAASPWAAGRPSPQAAGATPRPSG